MLPTRKKIIYIYKKRFFHIFSLYKLTFFSPVITSRSSLVIEYSFVFSSLSFPTSLLSHYCFPSCPLYSLTVSTSIPYQLVVIDRNKLMVLLINELLTIIRKIILLSFSAHLNMMYLRRYECIKDPIPQICLSDKELLDINILPLLVTVILSTNPLTSDSYSKTMLI